MKPKEASSLVLDLMLSLSVFLLVKTSLSSKSCNAKIAFGSCMCLIYGEPVTHKREIVWNNLSQWIRSFEYPFLLIGDFNQVDCQEDKWGGSKGRIPGDSCFNKWKAEHFLMDIPYKGPRFTWCNKREDHSIVLERLDKGYRSWDWNDIFPNSGSITVRMIRKLSRARNFMRISSISKRKEWNKNWSDFDDTLEKGLHEIEIMAVTRTYTTAYASQVEYAKVSAKYWKQRAKIKWNIEGDTCSKYFFNCVKGRAGRNYIVGIKMDNGEWNFDSEDIMRLFVHYYSGLFKEGVNEVSFDEYFPTIKNLFTVNKGFLSPDDSDVLGIHFTPKEVRTAVCHLGPLKSPGPDGIPAILFHKCWHFIKHDVIGIALAILNGNSSPEFLNKTFLVLIPKSSAPETVDQFRPISLCNVIMKSITRCITNRLKKFMGKLVGDFQNVFVPGRNIGNSKSCVNLDKVIKDYCHASGQGFLVSYLGIPTDVGLSGCNKSKREIFEFTIDKVRKRLSSWNCVLLLSAGHKKSPSISWCGRLFLSQPKGNGGLGIRRMKEFNQALLAKIGWRMITHLDSILSKSIGAKYGLRWQDGELLFNDGKTWNISPLCDLSVWNTKWVNGRVPKPLCLELLINPPNLSNLKIKNLISNNSSWDRRFVSMFFDETSVRDILAIPIRCSEGSDKFFWPASSSGNYSVNIGYHIALKNSWNTSATPKDRSRVPTACMGVFQKILWNLPGPKSWIILIWKLLTESLLCREGFLKRGFDGPFTCVLCDSPETETPTHLFRDCLFASRVWAGSVLGIRAQSGNNLNLQSWVCNWLSVLIKADNKQEAYLSFLCTIWTIWVVRCRKVFDNSECSPIGAFLLYWDYLNLALLAEDRKSGSITFQTPLEEDLTNLRNGVLFPLIQGSLNYS
ncbi:uncharacterized protein LOC141614226 [Silene latifolia]|uniref:uncharacterized protein LOC141614226 n=1 Tax=Silene latifolia TaxID=37657 RepID=UPI003D776068